MYNQAPANYDCPFCAIAARKDVINGTVQSDVIWHDEQVTAFIGSLWWENNKAHVIIVPNQHIENLFDLSPDYAAHIHGVVQRVGKAFMEIYGADGVSTRQHNGCYPLQEVWHYHLHVFPRYLNDDLYKMDRRPTTAGERLPYAQKLRGFLGTNF